MKDKYSDILVSIVVPVYNVKEYVGRCISSLIHQSHQKIEIILVDDGSTDGSSAVCDMLALNERRIKVIHKQNEGLGEARNTGIEAAKGDWLCFVDSDDFVAEQFVELLLDAAAGNDVLLAQCGYLKGSEEMLPELTGKVETEFFHMDDFFRFCCFTEGYSVFTCWHNLYHRSIFDTIRFLPLRHTEDIPFVQECIDFCADRGFVVVKQKMYYWYQRSGSIMNQRASLNLLDQIQAFEIVLEFWGEGRRNKPIIHDLFREIYFGWLLEAYVSLRRDLPAEQEKYEHLKDKIKKQLYFASRISHEKLNIGAGNFDFFRYLADKRVVLYGYGQNGSPVLPWLLHFNVKIEEIWDIRAKEHEKAEGVSIRKMHRGFPEDTVILLTVGNGRQSFSIKQELMDLGYSDILEWKCIKMACRSRIYAEYLPFLTGGME